MKVRRSIIGATLIVLASILPTGVAHADASASSPGAELALDRVVHRPALARALSEGPDLLALGPLFSRPGANRQFTLTSDLRLRAQESSPSLGLGVANLTRGRIAWMDNACAQGGYSSCSDVWVEEAGVAAPLGLGRLGLDFHALQRDADGTFWALAYPQRLCWERPEWSALCGPGTDAATQFLDCQIVGFDARGRVTTTWNASNHLPPSELRVVQQPQAFSTGLRDPFHCNSLEVLGPDARGLVVSMRHTDSVYAINLENDGIAWKLGGNPWPGHSLRLIDYAGDPTAVLDSQHDARMWGPGTLSVFDNGSSTGRTARGITFDIQPGKRTARVVREYSDPTGRSSGCTGSFRRIESRWLPYWVAGWGCSDSGATVFSDTGVPIVSTSLRHDDAATGATNAQMGVLRYSLSYRVTPLQQPMRAR